MGDKKKIYAALVDGATKGLSDDALYSFVLEQCPDTSNKKIVRASLLALSDPDLLDRNILNVIYALAIQHRLTDVQEPLPETHAPESKTATLPLPEKKAKKSKR